MTNPFRCGETHTRTQAYSSARFRIGTRAARKLKAPACWLLLLAIWLPLAGCGGPLLDVSKSSGNPSGALNDCMKTEGNTCQLPGVPFYAVGYRCMHTTAWLRPIYIVTLTVSKEDDRNFPAMATTVNLGLQEFLKDQSTFAHIEANPRVADYQPFWKEFTDLPGWGAPGFPAGSTTAADIAASGEAILVSNVVRPQKYIQAGTVLYYNVKKPWSGTTNAEVDLKDSGTIGKATGQQENTTLQTLASVFAPNGIVGTASTFATAEKGAGHGKKPPKTTPGPYHLQLRIVQRGYEYTFSAVAATPEKGTTPTPQALPCVPEKGYVGVAGKEMLYDTTVVELPSQPPAASPKPNKKASPPKPNSPSS